jgi:lysozyme
MQRPKLTREEALQIVKQFPAFDEKVFVLAIRGYYKNSMGKPGVNDIGIYDDAMFLFGPDYFGAFNANTDPAVAVPGKATLIPGLHRFKPGLHGFGRATKPYKAFRPATKDETLPVTRYGQEGEHRGQYINLHCGGEYQTNSAGCQTVIKNQWPEFQEKAYELLVLYNQHELVYLLKEQ